jgi:ankyrin repeat protein
MGKSDLEKRDTERKTPMQWAAEQGHEQVVRLLLQRGAVAYDRRIDAYDLGFNALALATHNLQESAVQLLMNWPFAEDFKELLVHGALSDTCDNPHSSPAFQLLMQVSQTLSPTFNNVYEDWVWKAAGRGDMDTISLILEAIKNPETKRGQLITALSISAGKGDLRMT